MLGRLVENALRGIQTKAVEVILLDPRARVGEKELAHWPRLRPVEVQGLAPVRMITIGEVDWRELGEIVALGAEVVVDDVEDHGEAMTVRLVHEAANIVGLAVEMA